MIVDCTEVEELAGAFALGAVPVDESKLIDAHLAECPNDHHVVRELMEVASLLPLACEEAEPPEGLRRSLMAAALAERGVAGATTRAIDDADAGQDPLDVVQRPAREPARFPEQFRWRTVWSNPGIWAAAALLFIAIGLGAWNASLHSSLDKRTALAQQQQQVLAALASGARIVQLSGQNDIVATLVQPRSDGAAFVVGNMPALPSGKAYEAWVIRDGKPAPAGVFKASGFSIMTLKVDTAGAQAVAFTIESDRGSQTPTLPIVAQAPVS
ncbi:MAG TPA: anti-sigma factor [Casimicrobiaceae bacterium]